MKHKRHKKILELIEKNVIETQEDLAENLRKLGMDITQATVSRDIKELQLLKVHVDGNKYRYGAPKEPVFNHNQERMKRVFLDSVKGFDFSENLIIIKTFPGLAQGVASVIDLASYKEIIGTVAGDDTILIIVKPKNKVQGILKSFDALMG